MDPLHVRDFAANPNSCTQKCKQVGALIGRSYFKLVRTYPDFVNGALNGATIACVGPTTYSYATSYFGIPLSIAAGVVAVIGAKSLIGQGLCYLISLNATEENIPETERHLAQEFTQAKNSFQGTVQLHIQRYFLEDQNQMPQNIIALPTDRQTLFRTIDCRHLLQQKLIAECKQFITSETDPDSPEYFRILTSIYTYKLIKGFVDFDRCPEEFDKSLFFQLKLNLSFFEKHNDLILKVLSGKETTENAKKLMTTQEQEFFTFLFRLVGKHALEVTYNQSFFQSINNQ